MRDLRWLFIAGAMASCGTNAAPVDGGLDGSASDFAMVDLARPDLLCADLDHDGYGVVPCPGLPGGDCDDADPLVNPGAAEIVGNEIDDNCDGLIDDATPSCDVNLAGDAPTAFANSMEVCAPWLLSAKWNGSASSKQRRIERAFGAKNSPKAGLSMALLSTGIAAAVTDPGYVPPQPGTAMGGSDPNPWPAPEVNACDGRKADGPMKVNDLVALTLTIKVPTNATGLSFSSFFFSSEYPEYVGNTNNDQFVAYLQSTKLTGDIAIDAQGSAISVESPLFGVCQGAPVCQGKKNVPCGNDALLDGTGYDTTDNNGLQMGGATGWLTTSAPVVPGETVTLTLFVFDAADALLDSAVLLDGFHWTFPVTPHEP